MIAILEQGECVGGMVRELMSTAWNVHGHRFLADGTEQWTTSCAWGATEERARAFFDRLQAVRAKQLAASGHPAADEPLWEQSQLTFCRAEESGGVL